MASAKALLCVAALACLFVAAASQPIASSDTDDLSGFEGTALAPYAAALSDAAPPLQQSLSDGGLFSEAKADPPLGATDPNLNAFLNDPILLELLGTETTLPELLAALPPAKAEILHALNIAPVTGDAAADELTIQEILGTAPSASGSRKLLHKQVA